MWSVCQDGGDGWEEWLTCEEGKGGEGEGVEEVTVAHHSRIGWRWSFMRRYVAWLWVLLCLQRLTVRLMLYYVVVARADCGGLVLSPVYL